MARRLDGGGRRGSRPLDDDGRRTMRRRVIIGRTLDHVHASGLKDRMEFGAHEVWSPRSIRHLGAGRGVLLDELVIYCRWDEIRWFDDVIEVLRPCFSTTNEPQIRWVIHQ